MARPRKASGERRDDQLNLRLTPAERVELAKTAAACGLSVAEFMRRRALGYRLPTRLANQHAEAAAATALIRLGVNLNQIAKHLNAGRSEPPAGLLTDLLSRISAELDALYDPRSRERPVV